MSGIICNFACPKAGSLCGCVRMYSNEYKKTRPNGASPAVKSIKTKQVNQFITHRSMVSVPSSAFLYVADRTGRSQLSFTWMGVNPSGAT